MATFIMIADLFFIASTKTNVWGYKMVLCHFLSLGVIGSVWLQLDYV